MSWTAVSPSWEGNVFGVAIDQSSGATHPLQISYDLSGTHLVLVQPPYIGEFGLRLSFSSAQVGVERAVQAICPPGATNLDECGCPTGTYDSAAADGAINCKPCNLNDMDCTRTGLTLATVPLLPSR